MKKIVIIGGGFAGLHLARKLSNKKKYSVTLIDRLNHHQFQPLLYQVATGGLDASDISFPLRRVLQKSKNIHVRMGEVERIDTQRQIVVAADFELTYDLLVIATGTDSNYFGNKDFETHAFGLKSTFDAIQLQNHLLKCFEKALYAHTGEEQRQLLNIVVAGAGATGVEISGAISDMRHYVLPKDFPEIDFKQMKIYMVDNVPSPLKNMSKKSSKKAYEYLKRLDVEMILGNTIQSYDGKNVILNNGESISAATLIWSAGVVGSLPEGIDKSIITKGNRLKVDLYNRVENLENVFAIGDIAFMQTEEYPQGHPQLAAVANAQADNLAKNLLSKKLFQYEFHYIDKGIMSTIGRNLAVADLKRPPIRLQGWMAWMAFMFLHLMLILGVKNRFLIFINWVYNYFTYDQSLRLIFDAGKEKKNIEELPS